MRVKSRINVLRLTFQHIRTCDADPRGSPSKQKRVATAGPSKSVLGLSALEDNEERFAFLVSFLSIFRLPART